MKKFLLSLVLLLVSLVMISCGNAENTSNGEISADASTDASSDGESKLIVSSEEAVEGLKKLLEKDKRNVGLFFENGMYELSEKNGIVSKINENSEYGDFSNVEKLFDIYTFPNVVKDYFFSFPKYGEKAVFEMNGNVYATNIISETLPYPSIDDFQMIELSLDSATFAFETKNGTQKVTLDFATNTLSDSPYHLMAESDYSDKWEVAKFSPTVKNLGSGKSLTGKTLIINVFITDKNSEWETDEVKNTLEKINEGVKWLQNLAEMNEVELVLSSTTPTTSLYYRSSSNLTTDADDQIWINEMFTHTTYGSFDEYIKTNCDVQNYDNYVVLFHLNKEGENNCGRYDSVLFEKELYKTERAVMYSNSTKKDYITAILYLFGAQPFGNKESEATRYFENEIMLEKSVFDDSIILGEITAYLIGWKNAVHPQLSNLVSEIFN